MERTSSDRCEPMNPAPPVRRTRPPGRFDMVTSSFPEPVEDALEPEPPRGHPVLPEGVQVLVLEDRPQRPPRGTAKLLRPDRAEPRPEPEPGEDGLGEIVPGGR